MQGGRWGYPAKDPNEKHTYWEHWKPDFYTCNIDDHIAVRTVGGQELPIGGPNPFGFIPMVYIPHIRIGNFRGTDAHTHLVGYTKELNLRIGDYGDAVNDDSHPVIAIRNVSGTPTLIRLSSWLDVVNLGSKQGLSNIEGDPDMLQVGTQRASPAMGNLLEHIYSQLRRDTFVPPVADGEDEGSQRSGMTLAMRFWPLISHAGIERSFWTPGIDLFQSYLLRMMEKKGLAKITKEVTHMRMKERWANMLPRDREVDVNEWVARAGAMLGSIEPLLELTGDVEDVEEERARLLQWKKDRLEIETAAAIKEEEAAQETQLEIAKVQGQNMMNRSPQGGGTNPAKPKAAKKPAGE